MDATKYCLKEVFGYWSKWTNQALLGTNLRNALVCPGMQYSQKILFCRDKALKNPLELESKRGEDNANETGCNIVLIR